jgi:serine/threonine protein kinase
MLWPSCTDYEFAIANMGKCVLASRFKGGTPVRANHTGTHEDFMSFRGGFSVVYPIIVGKETVVLRGWISDPGQAAERYKITSKFLKTKPSKYFVDFDYIHEGIICNGNPYPLICMEWIEGSPLSKFLDANIKQQAIILEAAEKFLFMVSDLHKLKISHGDLQDGNIMVCQTSNSISLKLVDYDSLYVPTLQDNQLTQERLPGVEDYQHPNRLNQSNETTDYFSELVIYLSLCAYGEAPPLWQKGQDKRLLFKKKDFIDFSTDPTISDVYKKIERLSPKVRYLAKWLIEFCKQKDTSQLVPLEHIFTNLSSSEFDSDKNINIPLSSPNAKTQTQMFVPKDNTDLFDQIFSSTLPTPKVKASPKLNVPKDNADLFDKVFTPDSRPSPPLSGDALWQFETIFETKGATPQIPTTAQTSAQGVGKSSTLPQKKRYIEALVVCVIIWVIFLTLVFISLVYDSLISFGPYALAGFIISTILALFFASIAIHRTTRGKIP